MLKLQARKQKHQEIQAVAENTVDPSSFLESKIQTEINIENQIAIEAAFANERKQWLKKLHDENQLLLQLLTVSYLGIN